MKHVSSSRIHLAAFVLVGLVGRGGAENLFDKYCKVDPPLQRYPIPAEGQPVIGNQKAWYTMPYDLKPGRFSMNCPGLEDVTDESFTVRPRSVVGKFAYRFTRMAREKPGENQLHDRKLISLNQARFDQLKQIADRNVLVNAEVTKVLPEGKGFECTIDFASGPLGLKVEVLSAKPNRIPEVHSRQYGPHAKHTFDIYYPEGFDPKTDKPLPMYVNIHGGGWGALDKMNARIGSGAQSYNQMGIAFVSVNYRYVGEYDQAPAMKVPVAAALLDAARAIQYIRYHAKELGVDPDRVCLTGGSAGGATSSWLAMVDDLADPDSPDPIARMSTRVTCSTPHQAQTSLDPKQMRQWIPQITYGAHAFFTSDQMPKKGNERFEYFLANRERILPWIRDFSAYAQASEDDPPMLLVYGGQDDVIPARDGGNATHHPKFGENLCKRLDELGVECHYWAGTQYGKEGYVKADNPRYHGWGGVKNFVGDKLLGPGWDQEETGRR
jgi:acetyl esterase/lipase